MKSSEDVNNTTSLLTMTRVFIKDTLNRGEAIQYNAFNNCTWDESTIYNIMWEKVIGDILNWSLNRIYTFNERGTLLLDAVLKTLNTQSNQDRTFRYSQSQCISPNVLFAPNHLWMIANQHCQKWPIYSKLIFYLKKSFLIVVRT